MPFSSFGSSLSSLGLDAVGTGNPNSTSGAALIGTDASAIGGSAGSTDTVQGVLEALHTAIAAAGGGGTVQGTGGRTYNLVPTNEGATAGNTRGENSVDLSTNRSAATMVASGLGSVISGGANNTNPGTYGVIAGGLTNTIGASRGYCTISGGNTHSTNEDYGTICGGVGNVTQKVGSTVLGGRYGASEHYGGLAHSAGRFTATGDAQRVVLQWREQTASGTQAEMFLDDSSARFVLANDDIYHCTIKIVAVKTNNRSFAVWNFFNVVVFKNGGSNVVVVNGGTSVPPDVNYNNGTDMSGLLVDVDADTSNQALRIQVTGVATTNWVACCDAIKVNS